MTLSNFLVYKFLTIALSSTVFVDYQLLPTLVGIRSDDDRVWSGDA